MFERNLYWLFGILVPMFVCSAYGITIDTVPVGNAGNAGEVQVQGTFGAVAYEYRIGTTEVTNAQYTEFLNAVAATDSYELYYFGSRSGITRSGLDGSYTYAVKDDFVGQGPGGLDGDDYTYGNKPAFVSWYSSIRFANWLHNGQGSGDTETGAYTILGGTPTPSNGLSITRNAGAKWFLPSEDEWYKAAYHKNDGVTGNYWLYPTSTDAVLNNNLPSVDTGNSANYNGGNGHTTGDPDFPLTNVGAYALSGSPYGTFDQGGNLLEWNEALVISSSRGVRGGNWSIGPDFLAASSQQFFGPSLSDSIFGFRVASIPEPALLAGNFDDDSDADGADFLKWQRDPGVGSFADWEGNYGMGASLLAASTAVPEPCTMLLGAMATVGLLLRRIRSTR